MEPGAIFLLTGMLVLVALFVVQPFTRHWRVRIQSSHEISTLLAERERILNSLMELDFDNGIGKIPAGEYSAQRTELIQKGAEILQRLDEIQISQPDQADSLVEALASEKKAALFSDEDLEDLIAKRRSTRQQKSAGFCPNCGRPILQSDLFCPACGQMVNAK
jgi:RNA polymerase-binding transcription factor DksA